MISANIKFDGKEINDVLTGAAQDIIRAKIKNVVRSIREKVIKEFYDQLTMGSDVFKGLRSNWSLQGDLGVENYYVTEAVRSISRMINVETIAPVGRHSRALGGIKIVLVKADISPILNAAYARYETEKGVTIPWLEWLLTRGTDIVVSGYTVASAEHTYQSRTGQLIMLPHGVGNFAIEESYAGTLDDNWITRAAREALPFIEKIIMEGIQK